jgi:hypothetical protein
MIDLKKCIAATACTLMLGAALAADAQVVVRIGPPPPPREVRPPSPHRGWVWRGGYQRWDGGRYVWVPGGWAAPPRGHGRWVPGQWARRGGGYVWIEGHWR